VYLYDYDGNRIIDFSSGLINMIWPGNQRITESSCKANAGSGVCKAQACVTKVRADLGKKTGGNLPPAI